MFLLAPWISGVGADDVDILPHKGRALIFLSPRHARRIVIGADAAGVPCIGMPFIDSRTFSTVLWERAILALDCIRPPSASRPGSQPRLGDFICLPGQERRNNGKFALWVPCRPGLLSAIIETGQKFQAIGESERGEARIGFYDVVPAGDSETRTEWLMGEDAAIVPLTVARDLPCNGDMAWRSSAAKPAGTRQRKGQKI